MASEKSYNYLDVNVCLQCCQEFDASLVPNNSYICFPCLNGFKKEESVLEQKINSRQMRCHSRKNQQRELENKKAKGEKLPIGVSKRFMRGHWFYNARYASGFTVSFSVSKYGDKKARSLAIRVRKKMEKLADTTLIQDYLEELRAEHKKAVKRGTDKSLPIGVTYGEVKLSDTTTYKYYQATLIIEGKTYHTDFNIRKLGKEKALELALKTRKKMESLKSGLKVRAFLNTEVEKWKSDNLIIQKKELPVGVSKVKEFYRKDGKKTRRSPECYQVSYCTEGKMVNIKFPTEIYGEDGARELTLFLNSKVRGLSLEKAKILFKKEGKELKEIPDLEYQGEEGCYEYNFDNKIYEGEVFVNDTLINFKAKNLKS